MSSKGVIVTIAILGVGLLYPELSEAYGLKTGFGKVALENVPMGIEYSMRKDSKFPLVIENNSDSVVEVKIEVLVPEGNEVQKDYEPIPSADWIKLEKDSFTIEPNGKAETDVVISIPHKEEYLGRKFHVFIWSHTIGESLGIGIRSKLLFSVGEATERQK